MVNLTNKIYCFNSNRICSDSFFISSTALLFFCFSTAVFPSPIDDAKICRYPIIVWVAERFILLIYSFVLLISLDR